MSAPVVSGLIDAGLDSIASMLDMYRSDIIVGCTDNGLELELVAEIADAVEYLS
jgi:hypothetical protein